jgi:hypothetical protein
MNKRKVLLGSLAAAAAPAALAAVLLGSTGTAFASTAPASNGQAGHMTGNQATSYIDPYFGTVQCNENQHPAFDNVTCKFIGAPAQNFTVGQTGQVGWNSDFSANAATQGPNPNNSIHSNQGTLTYTITGNATTGQVTGYTGQATYPASQAN